MNDTSTGPIDVAALAEILDDAARSGRMVSRPADTTPLDVPTAYQVQRAAFERRRARGERPLGVKLGFTSKAKMAQMGVDDLIWGLLSDGMLIEDGGTLDGGGLVHPRIEPEVAFLLGRPISADTPPTQVAAAVAGVAVAYEVLDSRYQDFRFTLPDVIADNASAAAFGVGPWHPPAGIANTGLILEIDGRAVATGSSAAILGDPLRSLAAAARLAGAAGIELEPGWIVLAGAATAAVPLPPKAHVRVVGSGLGQVEVTVR
ncbi:4-oxalocrotonate decarboxylase [Sphaerisporangium rufum]|uniref:4-oxalocrotonate decarboxylase n=1 Tax=Sphaerisporangium rufum TaxID=1381558 RepID=A0A919QXN2_9ACTN|nr:fumarylacetoacetate hydrolase family protein [Sphaerisporangium rufum]GII75158.1 4-oxalocrotonate decarboxylase [Sphaerisporangium rufum]